MIQTSSWSAMQSAIEQLGSSFEQKPFDFFAESDLQSRLAEYLRVELADRNENTVSYPSGSVPGGYAMVLSEEREKTDSFNKYIQNKAETQARSNTDHHLTRVHTEVYADEQFGLTSDNRLDIAILSTDQPTNWFRPIHWQEGKQKAGVEGMSSGIELKMLRRRTDFSHKIGDCDPAIASVSEIANNINLSFNGIEKDLDKSNRLGEEYYGLEMAFVLMSKYDCLYRGDRQEIYRSNYDVHRKIGDAIIKSINQKYRNVAVYYSSPIPNSSQWISQ